MKTILSKLTGFAVALALSALAHVAEAQTQKMPIPSGVCTANGQVLTAVDSGGAVQCSTATSGTTGNFSTSITVGSSGTAITQIRVFTVAATPTVISVTTCSEQAITVTGITTSDKLVLNPPTIAASPGAVAVAVRVSAADTAAVTFCNAGVANATPAAGNYVFTAFRS